MNIINYYRDKIKNILLDEFTLKESDLENVSFELPKESFSWRFIDKCLNGSHREN